MCRGVEPELKRNPIWSDKTSILFRIVYVILQLRLTTDGTIRRIPEKFVGERGLCITCLLYASNMSSVETEKEKESVSVRRQLNFSVDGS